MGRAMGSATGLTLLQPPDWRRAVQIIVAAFSRAIEISVKLHGKGTGDSAEPEFINLGRVETELADDDEDAVPFGFTGQRHAAP